MTNQKIGIFIFAIALILIAFMSGGEKINFPQPSKKVIDGAFVSKAGTFKFGDKDYRADYGTITVPENRRNAQSRLIHLPVVRIHALTKNINEPIFGLAGGPGQSNMLFRPVDSLLYDHDFIIVGYRGVDGSTVLDCPEVTEAMKNTREDLLSEESLREIGQAWAASVGRFKSLGIDLNGYAIPETVEDLEAVRKAFNYDRINLISESYGTRIAYIYGVMHPQIIHRSVMIGVNPPGGFVWDAKRTDEQIRYYSRLWAKDSVMSKKCPDLAAAMQKVLKNMPRKWLFFSIDPGRVKVTTFGMLFHRKEAAMVFDAYVAAEKGDYSGLALMSLAFNYVIPDMCVWGDSATKAISADLDYWQEEPAEDENTILGSPFNELYWKPFKYGNFTINMIPDSLRVSVKSDVETLLLSGSVDFTNPPEYATDLLHYLKNGRQIIMSEAGHVGDIRYLQLSATKDLIANYINKGIVDTSKIEYVPMDFQVSWGFPRIAKVALGIAAIVIITFLFGIVWLVRKIKRRKKMKVLAMNVSI